ncbi:unnamed protein product, partial [Prorocentrum cordatum]
MAGSMFGGFTVTFAVGAASTPAPSLRGSSTERSCAFWDGLDIKGSVCSQQWQGQYAGTASCKSCWEGEDCGWTCDLTDGTKAGVDLQAYVHASHGEGYCARNPSNDPCLGWQVFGDGCTDCAANGMSSSAQASASLQSTDPQRSCAFWDGLDIKGSVCPQQWQGQYAGTASCKSCWEGEDCGWTCDLTDGTKAGVDLQAYVHASHGEGHCARNPSNDPCLGWQVFGDGCTDCAANGMSSSAQASASLQSTDPQRSCAFWDGLDIKGSVCPQQWQGQYAGTASCKSCW